MKVPFPATNHQQKQKEP